MLWAGATAAAMVHLLVRSPVLVLDPVRSAVIEEAATLAAFGAGSAALFAVGRWKGWPEVSDVMNGLVYGAATGPGSQSAARCWSSSTGRRAPWLLRSGRGHWPSSGRRRWAGSPTGSSAP